MGGKPLVVTTEPGPKANGTATILATAVRICAVVRAPSTRTGRIVVNRLKADTETRTHPETRQPPEAAVR